MTTLDHRIDNNWPQEKWGEPRRQEQGINYEGKYYPSVRSLAIALKIPGRTGKLTSLLKTEDSVEKAVEKALVNQRDFRIKYNGKTYKNRDELAKELDISAAILYKRMRTFPESEWGKKIDRKVKYQGQIFASARALAIHLGIPGREDKLRRLIKSESTIDLAVQKALKHDLAFEIKYKNKTYTYPSELARDFGVSENRVVKLKKLLQDGKSVEKSIELAKKTKHEFEYLGITYTSTAAFARSKGLKDKEHISRFMQLIRDKIDPADAIIKATLKPNQITYKGQIFDSIRHLANSLNNVAYETLAFKIRTGVPEEEWDQISTTVYYKGKAFKNTKVLAEYLGVNHYSLGQRIRDGISEEQWGQQTKRYKVSMGYSWEELPITSKKLANQLAFCLDIDPVEAYKLLVNNMFRNYE